ncbi:MAG: hypothetical protein ABIF85_02630 [Nanoarchaeota archaeon]
MERRNGTVWQGAITKIICNHRGKADGKDFEFEIPDLVGLSAKERVEESTVGANYEYIWHGAYRSRRALMVKAEILLKLEDHRPIIWSINPILLDVLMILKSQPKDYFSLEEIISALENKENVTNENLTQWGYYRYIDELTHKVTNIKGYRITELGLTLLQDSKKTMLMKKRIKCFCVGLNVCEFHK